MTVILLWLFNLLEHTYHFALHPMLTEDYEGGSERIKGVAPPGIPVPWKR